MLLLDLFEARDKKKTYDLHEIKGQVERVTVRLEGSESAAFTKMAKEYKKIDVELKKLQAKRDALNAQAKDKIQEYFDAEDIIYTRVIETVSMSLSMSKQGKPTKKTDNDKVVEELVKIMPELADKIKELQKKFESETKGRSPTLTVTTNLDEGVKEVLKRIAAFIKGLSAWGTRYDAKLAKIKMMMKPQRRVAESYYSDKKPDEMKVKKFVKKLKDEAQEEEARITQEDVDKLVETLAETDGDQMLKRRDIKKLCKDAGVTTATVLQIIGFIDAPAEDDEAPVVENVVVRDPKTPFPRDAAYIKKVAKVKVGTLAVKLFRTPGFYVGDWVKFESGEHEGKFGFIVSKEFDMIDPDGIATGKVKIDISDGPEPEIVVSAVRDKEGRGDYVFRRYKRWDAIASFTDDAKVAGKIETKATKAAAKKSSTEMIMSDGTKNNVYGKTATPNMSWPTEGKPLHIDDTRPRTAEEKKATKDYIKQLETDLKIHKEFIEEFPTPYNADRKSVVASSERVINTFKKTAGVVDEYKSLLSVLNKAANERDKELFDEAKEEFRKLMYSLQDDHKQIKMRVTLPTYASKARTLAAIAIDHMAAEYQKVKTFGQRWDWTPAKKAAAKKNSDRMKMLWAE